jgi:NAD+ kinase
MKLAVLPHPERNQAADVAAEVRRLAAERGLAVGGIDASGVVDGDVIVPVGGDGTVLHAVRHALAADVPILGINVGHIGYLTAADPDGLEEVLDAIAAGRCEESTRMTIAARWQGGSAVGLNDVVLEKVISQHTVRITLDVGGRRFTTYRADGVVVATPTGSTAYAFSAGGPMLDPELEAFVVTPVAAHNLFAPTVLFAPDAGLTFSAGGGRRVRVNVDGRELTTLEPGEEVVVGPGERPARFLEPWPRPFDQVVREKFRLDGDNDA